MHIPFFTARRGREGDPARPDDVEAKASRAGALIAFASAGRPVWTPRDYAALAREGFARNAIVYRCVRLIAEASASVPWLLYDGAAEIDEHPLLQLLARPNRRQAGADFREAIAGHLLTAGNAYVEAVPATVGRAVNGIEIDVTAGYGASSVDVPSPLRQAIMMLVAHWYEHRGAVGHDLAGEVPPHGFHALIAPYRKPRSAPAT